MFDLKFSSKLSPIEAQHRITVISLVIFSPEYDEEYDELGN